MTCFEASKAQILTGRCGLSLHLLNTSDSSASSPRAPWMKRANGPSSLHSPPSAPGLDPSPSVELDAAVATANMAEAAEDDVIAGAVEEAIISASPAGTDVVAAARIEKGASSGSDM